MLGANRQRGHGGRIGPHLVTEPLHVGKRRSEAVGVSLLVLAALAVSFGVLARRARQRLRAALPHAREAAVLHFAPAPPPSVSLLVLHALALLSGVLWAHALRSDVLPPAVVSLGSRTWLVLAVLWLAVRTGAPTRRG